MKYFFTVFIITSVAFSACVDDYDAPCREQVIAKAYTFSSTDAAVIPYGEHDTLVFVAGTGDSLYIRTSQYADTFSLKITDQPNNPECPNDFESHQVVVSRLKDTLSSFDMVYYADQPTATCQYTIGTSVFKVTLSAIGVNDSTFLDSVMLGNTMFYNVNQFTGDGGNPVYIHPTLGLLQLLKDNKLYTLQRFNHKPWK